MGSRTETQETDLEQVYIAASLHPLLVLVILFCTVLTFKPRKSLVDNTKHDS